MVVNMASLPSTVILVAGAVWGRCGGRGNCAGAVVAQRASASNPILTFSKCLKIIWSCRARQCSGSAGTVWPAHESWMAVSPVDTDIHESRCHSLLSMYRRCPRRVKETGSLTARKLLCLVDVEGRGRRCLGCRVGRLF